MLATGVFRKYSLGSEDKPCVGPFQLDEQACGPFSIKDGWGLDSIYDLARVCLTSTDHQLPYNQHARRWILSHSNYGGSLYQICGGSTDLHPHYKDNHPDGMKALLPFLWLSAEDPFRPGIWFESKFFQEWCHSLGIKKLTLTFTTHKPRETLGWHIRWEADSNIFKQALLSSKKNVQPVELGLFAFQRSPVF